MNVALCIFVATSGHLRRKWNLFLDPLSEGDLFLTHSYASCADQASRKCQTCTKLGPINLCDEKASFDKSGQQLQDCNNVVSNCDGTTKGQLPKRAHPFYSRTRHCGKNARRRRAHCGGKFDWLASEPALTEAARVGEDISPDDYPHAATDLRAAIENYAGLTGKDVLVAGSISPWVEAIVSLYSPKSITTSDYNVKTKKSNLTNFVDAVELRSKRDLFDAVFSFSSIEHDGLGRYCDPINPDGDIVAMKEFHQLLRPGGTLFLGVPVDGCSNNKATIIEGNSHRIYDKRRFERLTCGFHNVSVINTNFGFSNSKCGNWQNQPWFLLHRD